MVHWLLTLILALAVRAGLAGPCAAPPRLLLPRCSARGYSEENKYIYTVDGMDLQVDIRDGGKFLLKCSGNHTLDSRAMPRFESQLRVYKAALWDCGLPRSSYGDVLRRLNVFVSDKLEVSGAGRLAGAHFADLGHLHALDLFNVELKPRTLATLTRLRSLFMHGVRLPPGELNHLPRSLEALEVVCAGADVPRGLLERLPRLVNLAVRDLSNLSVVLGGTLRELALEMPAARVPSTLTPELRSLTVFGWAERRPAPWTTCALETLYVRNVTAEELPARWVSNCTELRVLKVQYGLQLRALHATSLRGVRHLVELHLTNLALTTLPEGLLDDAEYLLVLDLSNNFLMELPSGLFMRTHGLQKLDLSRKQLTADVFTSLKAITSLRTLTLRTIT